MVNKTLHYTKHWLILASAVIGCASCVSISAFASSVGIPVSVASSEATIKICVITEGTKRYKSIIKKKKKKPDEYFWQKLI